MTPPLTGRTIALAEGRQLEELVQMLEKEGATPLRCPLVSILDAPDPSTVAAWLRDLAAGRFSHVILMTGEAWRRMRTVAEREGIREAMIEAARKTRILTRGPKPVRALKEDGLSPALTAQVATTEGVIAALRSEELHDRTVGVTLYGSDNPTLVHFLEEAGATVRTVMPYGYAPAADADQVVELIGKMSAGEVDAIIFTSSPQVERLFEVAVARGSEPTLREGLERTCVAAVGPVVADSLRHHAVRVDVVPEQGFVMKNLVTLLRRHLTGQAG